MQHTMNPQNLLNKEVKDSGFGQKKKPNPPQDTKIYNFTDPSV